MKRFKSIYSLIATLAVGMTAGGCSDNSFDDIKGSYELDREVVLTLNLPAFVTPATRGVDYETISDVKIYFLEGDVEVDTDTAIPDENNKIVVKVPGGVTNVRLVANYGACSLGENSNEMDFNPNEKTHIVFYGETTKDRLEQADCTVDLYRSYARSTFENAAENFMIENLYFCGKPSKGLVNYKSISDLQNIPSDVEYADYSSIEATDKVSFSEMTSENGKYSTGYYHYEAEKGECFWVIEGKYDNSQNSSFYKIGFIKKDDTKNLTNTDNSNNAEEMAIIRNCHYKFTISKVNSDGYVTFEEAVKSKPDNRLEVLLENYSENIFNMISCRDYYLGVQPEVYANSAGPTVTFDVVSNYSGEPKVFISDLCSWLSDCTISEAGTDGIDTSAKRYHVSLKIAPNSDSTNERGGEVYVRVGDLKQTVRIIQDGTDFFFDANNRWKVGIVEQEASHLPSGFNFNGSETGVPATLPATLLATSNGSSVQDYFMMLNSIKGLTEEEMSVPRNDGLHFSVYVENPDHQFIYRIPKLVAGATATLYDDNGKFECKDKGDYFEVACTDEGNKNYDIWHGRLLIQQGIQSVVYEVYHTGIFHELTDIDHQMNNPDGDKASGWFYYEQVDVEAKGETYHILDRNIGASSNKFYSPSSTFARENKDSRGAYFCVTKTAGMDEIEALLPKGFNNLPGKYHYLMNPPSVINAADVQSGWRTINGLQSWVYVPVAGAMDGDNHIDEMHAELWSGTMVEGIQGFYEGEADYGLWYRVLDFYGTATVPTVRIKSRATGALRGIPVRAMQCPPPVAGADLPDVANSRSRIILYNTANWTGDIYVHVINLKYGSNTDTKDEKMVKGDDDGSWYYADLKGIPAQVSFKCNGQQTQVYNVTLDKGVQRFYNDGTPPPPVTITRYEIVGTIWNGSNSTSQIMTESGNNYVLTGAEVKSGSFHIVKKEITNGVETSSTDFKFSSPSLSSNVEFSISGSEWSLGEGRYNFTLNPVLKTLRVDEVHEIIYRIYWPSSKESSFIHLWTKGSDGERNITSWGNGKNNNSDVSGYNMYEFKATSVEKPNDILWFKLEKDGDDTNTNQQFGSVFSSKVGNYFCAYIDSAHKIHSGKPTSL